MRAGHKVYDSDTHVNPAAQILDRYVDPGFRLRLAQPTRYRIAMHSHGGTENLQQAWMSRRSMCAASRRSSMRRATTSPAAVFLQHRAPRGRSIVRLGAQFYRRRCHDVGLGLCAFRMSV